MPEASVVLVADVRGGQERLLSRAKQHQVRREQRAVEHLVELAPAWSSATWWASTSSGTLRPADRHAGAP